MDEDKYVPGTSLFVHYQAAVVEQESKVLGKERPTRLEKAIELGSPLASTTHNNSITVLSLSLLITPAPLLTCGRLPIRI